MKKKILIHSLVFSPDGVSTAYLLNDIALEFQRSGYEVIVLTTTPHFNVVPEQIIDQPTHWGLWGVYKKSSFHGIPIIHVPQKKFHMTFLRLIGFVYWHILSFFIALFIKNVDIIFSPSPPLTIGFLNLLLAKLKNCKVVYNVQEIYPDILEMKKGLVFRFLSWMEHFIYAKSDAITTIDQVFYDTLIPRMDDKDKLKIIPNFVDTTLYHPDVNIAELDSNIFPRTKSIKLVYAGNIGMAQSWEPLIEIAQATKDINVEYFVIGEGVRRDYVEEQIHAKGLHNVHLLPYQPRHLMPAILAYSDAQFIFMDPEKDRQGFPSKVYTIMACAKPLLVCSGEDTPIVNFLKQYECAKLITNRSLEQKVAEMSFWLHSITKNELQLMGRKGVEVIKQYYTKEVVTQQYVSLMDSLLLDNGINKEQLL